MADYQQSFVALDSPTARRNHVGFHPCQGNYFSPRGKRPKTALIATHYNVDFSEHYLAPLMAERGYGFLGWNTRFRGAEAYFLLEHALIDIGVGVRWLRDVAGVECVVILGNSGGASLMGAYQSQAASPNIRPARGLKLPDAVLDLPRADFYIALAAHLGRPEVLTAWMDPSVIDENDPVSADPGLDMYNPANGPPYTPEFAKKYRAAQVARNDRITAWAIAGLDRLQKTGVPDRLFTLQRTWADLRMMDPAMDPSGRPPAQCYAGDPRAANYSAFGIGACNTLRTWLSMWSLRESQCRGAPHLQRITVPSLVINATADTGIYPGDAQILFAALAAKDKTFDQINADHYLASPATARPDAANRIAAWLAAHGA